VKNTAKRVVTPRKQTNKVKGKSTVKITHLLDLAMITTVSVHQKLGWATYL
jgi:hypothetical protein